MEGCSIELCEDDTQHYCFQIVFHGQINKDGKIYYLAAEDQDEMEGWMKSLTCASYDYMKLMVQELQRQLDEINTNNKGVLIFLITVAFPNTYYLITFRPHL